MNSSDVEKIGKLVIPISNSKGGNDCVPIVLEAHELQNLHSSLIF